MLRESRDIEVPQVVRLLYHYAGWAQLFESELQGYKPYGVYDTPLPLSDTPQPFPQDARNSEFFLCFVFFLHIAPCHFGQVLHSVMDGTCLQHITEIMNASKILNTISKDPT